MQTFALNNAMFTKKIAYLKRFFCYKPYFLLNFSTFPLASTTFFFPVKNGWHLLQMSMLIVSPFAFDLVLKVFPQAQVTVTS